MTAEATGQQALPFGSPASVATPPTAILGRHCHRGAVLVGRQRLYCSPRCRVASWDRQHPRLGRPRRYGVVAALHSDGVTYDPQLDGARLATLRDRIVELMRDGIWRYPWEIQAACGGSENGVTAKLRDLRKAAFRRQYGVLDMESRRQNAGSWLYRVTYER